MNILEWGRNVGTRVYDFLLRVANSIISLFRWKTDTKGKGSDSVRSEALSSEVAVLSTEEQWQEKLIQQVNISPEGRRQSIFILELQHGADTLKFKLIQTHGIQGPQL